MTDDRNFWVPRYWAFHGENRGSNPLERANKIKDL